MVPDDCFKILMKTFLMLKMVKIFGPKIIDAVRDLLSVTIWRLHGRTNACEWILTIFSTFVLFLSVYSS